MQNGLVVGFMLLATLFFLALIVTLLVNILVVPMSGTPKKVIKEILKLMNLKEGDNLHDFGGGDGGFIAQAVTNYKVNAYIHEISPLPAMIAKFRFTLLFKYRKQIHFQLQSFTKVDISEADIIYCYLNERALKSLKKKFIKLPATAELFSYRYAIPGIKASKEYELSNGNMLFKYTYESFNALKTPTQTAT